MLCCVAQTYEDNDHAFRDYAAREQYRQWEEATVSDSHTHTHTHTHTHLHTLVCVYRYMYGRKLRSLREACERTLRSLQ